MYDSDNSDVTRTWSQGQGQRAQGKAEDFRYQGQDQVLRSQLPNAKDSICQGQWQKKKAKASTKSQNLYS